jgi:endogenous inhibitor of DNA gyrase (YacG/DUF329 family)
MGQAVPNKCPICKKPTDVKFRPFCSARCANVDLGGWLTEKYAVPTPESPDDPQNPNDDSGIE